MNNIERIEVNILDIAQELVKWKLIIPFECYTYSRYPEKGKKRGCLEQYFHSLQYGMLYEQLFQNNFSSTFIIIRLETTNIIIPIPIT